jgi:hypothetical protein
MVSAIAYGEYGQYQRRQVGTLCNGWPIVRSHTPTMGAWYWIAVKGADKDWHPFGGRTFDSMRAVRAFAQDRGFDGAS